MIDPELLALLVCPETHQELAEAAAEDVARINEAVAQGKLRNAGGQSVTEPVDGALIRADGRIAYPIRDEIPVMLVAEGLAVAGLELKGKFPSMADLTGKKLGVLITTRPEHPNFRAAVALMRAAIAAGVRVYLYCIDEGVHAVGTPEIQGMKGEGVHLFGCAYGAGNRKLPLGDAAAWSGLTVLADVVGSTDRFVSF